MGEKLIYIPFKETKKYVDKVSTKDIMFINFFMSKRKPFQASFYRFTIEKYRALHGGEKMKYLFSGK